MSGYVWFFLFDNVVVERNILSNNDKSAETYACLLFDVIFYNCVKLQNKLPASLGLSANLFACCFCKNRQMNR